MEHLPRCTFLVSVSECFCKTVNLIGPGELFSTFRRNPIAIALGLVVIYFLVFAFPSLDDPGRFGHGHGVENAKDAADQLGLEATLALSILLVILMLGWAKSARLSTIPDWRRTFVLIPPLVYIGILFATKTSGDGPDLGTVLALQIVQRMVLVALLVGMFEELLFRGAVLRAVEVCCGVTVAFFVSSLLFGLMHYVNWVGGQPFANTTLQVAHAAGSGLMYAAIVLVTRSIWFSIAFHALWDCSIFLIGVMSVDTPVDGVTAAGDSGGFLQVFLLLGLEPVYGLLLFWWWRRSVKTSGSEPKRA